MTHQATHCHRGDHALGNFERRADGVDCIKQRFLVLLQILVVRRRQTLERHQEPGHLGYPTSISCVWVSGETESDTHAAEYPTCLSPQQLQRIRILFLRHDARSGATHAVQRASSRLTHAARTCTHRST